MSERRCFLDRDNSGHWYIVRADRRTEWEAWVGLPEDDEASWDAPDFAEAIGGNPNTVEFIR